MRLYADSPTMRTRQILSDAAMLVWVFVWLRAGAWAMDLVLRLADPGRVVEDAAREFAAAAARGGARAEEVPLVGPALAEPFDGIAEAAAALGDAGALHQEAVANVATWVGWTVAAPPIVIGLLLYGLWRFRAAREAAAAARLRDAGGGDELFALRALANRPLRELRRLHADPYAAFQRGEVAALAALELHALGLAATPALQRQIGPP